MNASFKDARTVAGPETRCDGGEENAHASRVAAQLAMADGEGGAGDDDQEELPALHVGDHVTDRDTEDDDEDSATVLVVGLDTLQADAYELGDGGPTVAEVNPAYPETDDVVEVTFPQRTHLDVDTKRYAYPRQRLRLEHPIHERNDDEGEVNE